MKRIIPFVILLALLACHKKQDSFQYQLSSEAKPWTHEQFDAADEKFTFAIFSDLTGGERDGVFEVAIAQINLLRPELIVSVGDLVDGGYKDTVEWKRQWDWFDQRADKARAPIFYTGGNHDLTGEMARGVWKTRYNPRYYHFRYKDVLFLVMDTEDNTVERMEEIEQIRTDGIKVYMEQGPEAFASTAYATLPERESGKVGKEQADYFVKAIEDNPNVLWSFVLIHKPAWKAENEQNFAAIENILANRPYTVFYGHTHVYDYEERLGRDYINLATTGGAQFPDLGRSMDHVTLVTVDKDRVDIANLLMAGILDKKGQIPMQGDTLCFEKSVCDKLNR